MKLKLVAIAKNEDKYLREWVGHHLSIGVDMILLFDNESTDNTHSLLQEMSFKQPIQTYVWETVEGVSPQLSAYNFALHELCNDGDCVGFIDIDEFIIPSNGSLKDILNEAFSKRPEIGAICVNQRVFGSSWLEHYSPEPVLRRFQLCSPADYEENLWVKSFYRVGYVDKITGSHSSRLSKGIHVSPNGQPTIFTDENYSKSKSTEFSCLQLNHYITKSLEEFLWKRERGGVIGSNLKTRMERYENMDFFTGRQPGLNAQRDPQTQIYADQIIHKISALS